MASAPHKSPAAEAPAAAAQTTAEAPAAAESASFSSSTTASALGKRKVSDWMGKPSNGVASSARPAATHEAAAKLSSIKSKLSKPRTDAFGDKPLGEEARRVGLSREELLANQRRHEDMLLAKGKAVPHYRKL